VDSPSDRRTERCISILASPFSSLPRSFLIPFPLIPFPFSCVRPKVFVLESAPLSEVLQTLYSKSLFTLALQVAKSRGSTKEGVADVHRRYGDWLYEKGDWEGAVGQYVKTIGGGVQGSYVIRKVRGAALHLSMHGNAQLTRVHPAL
jgi:hypothetical protein